VRTAECGGIGLTFSVFWGGKIALRERVGLPTSERIAIPPIFSGHIVRGIQA
jgi:hypothetical protein